MRKLISLGLGTVTAASLAFGMAAPAAHATSITSTVCTALPAQQATAASQLSVAGFNATTAGTKLTTAQTELNTAFSDWVNAVVNHIKAVDSGGDTVSSKAALDAAISTLAQKLSAWSTANVNNFNSQNALYSAQTVVNALSQLGAGLCA